MTLSIGGSLAAPVVAGWLVDVASWSAAFGFGGALAVAGVAAVASLSAA
jgi:MFS family permease